MKRFSIIAKNDDKSLNMKEYVKVALCKEQFIYDEVEPELVICIGGDGTLLAAVHRYITQLHKLYFVAIHAGTLGFFTDYTEDNLEQCIQDIICGEIYEVYTSKLLEAQVNDYTVYALNEIRIENIMRTQMFDIYIDDEFFEKFKGNGICLSTQAGSTAYNRSLKGAVVDSGLSLMQLSEIAGIHDSKHQSLGVPYILKDDRSLCFTSDNFENAYICYDHKSMALENIKDIHCKMSDKAVRFIRYRKYSYLERVRSLY